MWARAMAFPCENAGGAVVCLFVFFFLSWLTRPQGAAVANMIRMERAILAKVQVAGAVVSRECCGRFGRSQ